jgi:oligopeptide/dipeptide ABC transporter ATP-binding protein
MAMLLITHDMGVIAGHADRVAVMYAGRVVETADAGTLFSRMRHPYSQGLLASIPRLDRDKAQALPAIGGLPPDLARPPAGCRFAARCPRATGKCRADEPPLDGMAGRHLFACWHPVDGPSDGAWGTGIPARPAGHAAQVAEHAAPAAGPAAPRDSAGDGTAGSLLELRNLVKEYPVTAGGVLRRTVAAVHAVSDVSFSVPVATTFGLVGESGCGKTTIGKMIVALEKPDSGGVTLAGLDVSALRGGELRRERRDLQLMFQDPHASLDPRMRVGAIVGEPLAIQRTGSRQSRRARVVELLAEVGLPRDVVDRYPHEFSGGQRQRIGLARALALNPRLIVADEPVSALDVSIRAQVLNLMKRLQADHGLTYVLISHDLAVVRYLADQIGVMYLGKLVELGPADDIYSRAAHPYTAALMAAIPVPDPGTEREKQGPAVAGELPSPVHPPSGCRFRTRCQFAQEACATQEPPLRPFGPGHVAACHFPLQPVAADLAGQLPARPASRSTARHVTNP